MLIYKNRVIQPLTLDSVVSSEVVEDNIEKNYDNIEFDVDTLIDSFDI
ncbi:6115_t:CDS:2 [Cetraspora pellucida]|uniref:6115_t:CDS:1 n=1 Tax=Cetraspora pellucida TaxID=1433469 RepID=A0A9N9A8T6_9GLOM|nr:6115_t:CDS:2 [Cetraspora pellucida]